MPLSHAQPEILTRRQWLYTAAGGAILGSTGSALADTSVRNGPRHQGQPVNCDLPPIIRVENSRGIDGLGLCVWASAEMMARYLYCPPLIGVFEQMKHERGGGWPDRVTKVMKKRAPDVAYRQYLGSDLEFIQSYINTGRPVCVTYGYGEIYRGTIAHMVLCVGMNDKYTVIIDNNDIDVYTWMTTAEFQKRFVHPRNEGWAWCIHTSPPPPVPHNRNPIKLKRAA